MSRTAVAVVAALALALIGVAARPQPFFGGRAPGTGGAAYDENVAKYAVRLCSAAYSDNPQACALNSPTLNVTATFNATFLGFGAFAFTAVDSGSEQIVIAVRGTNSVTQLIEEALTSVVPVPFLPDPTLQVNSYFYGCEGLWYDDLKASVQQLIAEYPSYGVFITGHSLGGAVASITAMHLAYDEVIPAAMGPVIYTLGEPRTGDYAFAQKFNALFPTAYRLVHYKDVVAHLPPCHASFNSKLEYVCDDETSEFEWAYQHGTEVWYQEVMPDVTDNSQGSFQTCSGAPFGEDPNCSDGLVLKDSIDDHTHYFLYQGTPLDIGQFCSQTQTPVQPNTVQGYGAN